MPHDRTFYSDCEPHNSMKLGLSGWGGGGRGEGERNGRNGSIRFSPRPLSSDPRAPRDPVRGDPFRRRFARNSVSPRQSSSIGLNGAIGIARSLPGNGVSFRSVPFRFVTTKARYRVSNLDVSTRVRRCSPTPD